MSTLAPTNEADLADAVRQCASDGTPLEIAGGRTRLGLGRPVQAEKTLSSAGLSGITLYEPGALTLVARAGTPMAEIDAALASERQMLAFEPMDHRALLGTDGAPTIGGVVATGTSGPRRLQRGACRDAMIGVRFVDGIGNAITNGGRVMKNVTGYDLVKLMAGTYGTLGVLSEISFKLIPAPEKTVTLVSRGLSFSAAVEAFSATLGSSGEPTGAAFLPGETGGALLRVEGLEQSVDHRIKMLRDLLAGFGTWESVEGDASSILWQRVRDAEDLAGTSTPVWRVSVKPTDGPKLIETVARDMPLDFVADWAGGLLWITASQDLLEERGWRATRERDVDAGASALHQELQENVDALGGHVTLVRASIPMRAAVDVFQPEDAVIQRLSAGLRQKFDPKGILNPGRMG
ncbi:MAG: FAD-binding protein [Pseudomonadota bacterium]